VRLRDRVILGVALVKTPPLGAQFRRLLLPMKITLSLLSAASLVVCSSCVFLGPGVPVRVSTETKDISGAQRDLDFSFLKAGSTTKDEVLTNLKPIDTGIQEPHPFWGRWESSAWFSAPLLAPTSALVLRTRTLCSFESVSPRQTILVLWNCASQ